MTWDPDQCGRFAGPRVRAAIELLSRVDLDNPALVHDIGCGRGEIARAMADRWPDAHVVGSDLSSEMLDAARELGRDVEGRQIDLGFWEPMPIHDLLSGNAVLHWLSPHSEVFPRRARGLRPSGVLAVQNSDVTTTLPFSRLFIVACGRNSAR